ncbi:MAG: hypothetical protein ACFFKA_15040 [Candidatus Thorarchaeota archaeon]
MNKQKMKFGIFLSIFIVSLICTNIILLDENLLFNRNDEVYGNSDDLISQLKTSNNGKPALNYSAFFQNASSVYRLIESIEFDINTASFPYANYSIMKIDYSDNSNEMLLMNHVSGTNNFTYKYAPKYNTPLGFHNVSFLIYNLTDEILSSDVPITNFTVKTNYFLLLNSSSYHKDNTLYGELLVSNEPTPYNFNWNITVVDNVNETLENVLFHVNNNVQQFSFRVDNRFNFSNTQYFIKLNLSDSSNNLRVPAYFPFNIMNSDPNINISTVTFSATTIKRTEECTLTLNTSDIDYNTFPENLTTSIIIKDSIGVSQSPISLTNNNNWSFSGMFSISSNKPIGIYEITIELEDQYGGTDSYKTTITVENNPPEIHGYRINGFSMEQSIEIDYGDDITFNFNISDIENTIDYVTVHLLNENDEWYNVTKVYSQNMKFFIRTEELLTGVWHVYISVTDRDGATTYLTSDFGLGPQELRIIPDLLTPTLPWILFIIGLLIGLLGGLGILYKRFKSKTEEGKEIVPKKTITDKKSKREQKEIKEEPKKIPTIDSEKPEERAQPPQRRIKRKLK